MDSPQTPWTTASMVVFRFLFVYFILYILPFPFGFFESTANVLQYYTDLWYAFIPWVAKNILQLKNAIKVFPNGSGDTTYNYVHVFTLAALSLIVCLIWSILDRRRKSYDQAFYWSMIAMRYYLGSAMIGYGLAKVFMMQFQLNEARLTQTYGESSPMGLLWTFMGYSYAYNLFTGFAEVLGGVLVMFRRTATTGALLLVAILSNVVVLNFTYDVPVKLYSSHLLFLSILICLLDGKRIVNFLLNRPAEPRAEKTFNTSGRIGQVRFVGNFVLIAAWLGMESMTIINLKKQFAPPAKSPLSGNYEVTEFIHDGPATVDSIRWESMRLGFIGSAKAVLKGDRPYNFTSKIDTTTQTFRLESSNDRYVLTYKKLESGEIELSGVRVDFSTSELRQQVVSVKLKKSEKDNVLTSRGFNWINEYPFNR